MKAQAVSGETPKRELAEILARYERGDIDVLVNAQLLAEGWNSPRATVCMHLAPTASKRIYQQRVGRVTRRQPGKEAGIVVDFVHPATKHDDPVVTLHSLLDRDVYRGGAIVVGPVRRGRGRRLRVERRVLPVTADENRRIEVFERELWRIAVEHLDYGEQVQWAALAGARVAPAGWRRARAMLHFDQGGELKRTFLLTAVERNKNPQLRLRALQEIAARKDAEAFDRALDFVEGWPRDDKREGVKVVLQALAEKKIGRRDQANDWIWRCANLTARGARGVRRAALAGDQAAARAARELSGGRTPATRAGSCTPRASRTGGSSAALLAAALPHTAEAGEVIERRPHADVAQAGALARELLRNFPKGKGKRSSRRRRKKGAGERRRDAVARPPTEEALAARARTAARPEGDAGQPEAKPKPRRGRSRARTGRTTPTPATPRPRRSPGRAGGRGRGEAQAQARPAQDGRAAEAEARRGDGRPRRSPARTALRARKPRRGGARASQADAGRGGARQAEALAGSRKPAAAEEASRDGAREADARATQPPRARRPPRPPPRSRPAAAPQAARTARARSPPRAEPARGATERVRAASRARRVDEAA